jgi:hypothetical protein
VIRTSFAVKNNEMCWLKASKDVVVTMHHETSNVKVKEQVGLYESMFNPDVENAIVKRVLDLEFLLFVLHNGVLKLVFGMHKRLLGDNLA